jgi:flagellar motor protein MotB
MHRARRWANRVGAMRLGSTRKDLRADIDATGYFPELVEEGIVLAVADEELLDFVVHHEPTFDRDEIHRHVTVLALTPTRLVVGHTDDQRIKSLRFQDNFELSRERAVSVVTLLQKGIDNRARLTWTGVGASQPRYRPESDPENRARNRRVEIIHVRGT